MSTYPLGLAKSIAGCFFGRILSFFFSRPILMLRLQRTTQPLLKGQQWQRDAAWINSIYSHISPEVSALFLGLSSSATPHSAAVCQLQATLSLILSLQNIFTYSSVS